MVYTRRMILETFPSGISNILGEFMVDKTADIELIWK